MEEKIQILQNQVNSLQQRVIHLEDQTNNYKDASKYPHRGQNKAPEATKSIHKGDDYTLDSNKGPYSIANQIKVASLGEQIPISSNKESDILSAQQEQPLESQPYNLSSNQNQSQNESYFKTSEATSAVWRSLGKISEEDKSEIIKRGFQLS